MENLSHTLEFECDEMLQMAVLTTDSATTVASHGRSNLDLLDNLGVCLSREEQRHLRSEFGGSMDAQTGVGTGPGIRK